MSLDVTNNGNVTAKGSSTVALYLSTDGTVAAGGTPVIVKLPLGLAAGKSKPYKLKFAVPAAATAGTYTLVAVLDPDGSLGQRHDRRRHRGRQRGDGQLSNEPPASEVPRRPGSSRPSNPSEKHRYKFEIN